MTTTVTDDVLRRWQAAMQQFLTQIETTAGEIQEKVRRLEQIAQQMKRGTK